MQRYFVDEINNKINSSDVHHIKNVMRMKMGDEIIICDNKKCIVARLTDLQSTVITYEEVGELERPKQLDITLFQGMPKASKVEDCIRYATIFNASKIVFFTMNRSVVKTDLIKAKQGRYEKIIKEASELAHRYQMPSLEIVSKIDYSIFNSFDLVFLFDEEEHHNFFSASLKDVDLIGKRIALVIGPEGGITKEERDKFSKYNKISLGKTIFPTELACIYPLTVLNEKILTTK